MCLNETKATANTIFNIPGYTLATRKERKTKGGGGCAILVKDYVDCRELEVPEEDICAITLYINKKEVCIISTYWGFAQTIEPTQNALKTILNNHRHCIILGDFNAHHSHWDTLMRPNKRGKEVKALTKDFNLTIFNQPNTHTAHNQHQNKRSTTIDLAIATELIASKDFLSLHITDAPVEGKHYHSPLILSLKTHITDHPITSQKIISKCNWEKFRNNMIQTCRALGPLQASAPLHQIDSHIAKFTSDMAKHLWDSCPTRKQHQGLHRISAQLLQKIKLKQTLQRQAKDHPNIPQIKSQLNTLRKEIATELVQEKDARIQREIAGMNPRNSKKFWQTFNHTFNTQQKEKKHLTLIDPTTGNKTTNNSENATVFAKHLQAVHQTHKDTTMNHQHKQEVDAWAEQQPHLFQPTQTPQTPEDDYCRPFTHTELTNALKTMNFKSAPGKDTIPYRAIQELPQEAKEHLTHIYNICLSRGYFPKEWKIATGRMILKPNKPRNNPGSYRPISLLNCLGKTFEKLLTTRIHQFIDDKKLINTWQRAYLPNKEANEHIYSLGNYINAAKSKKKLAALLLIDVEKAFDAVWHNGLRMKLHNMNLPPTLLRIISSFLQDRTIQVKEGNNTSHKVPLDAGTPQGSILSPLLFLLYVNDVPIIEPIRCTQYADDIGLYTSHKNKNYLQRSMQRQINTLEDWCHQWFIKLNSKKTQLILFKPQIKQKPKLKMAGTDIETTDRATLLGTTLDPRMNMMPHLDTIKQKIAPRIKKLIELRNWGATKHSLRLIYLSLIRPIMETGYHLGLQEPKYMKKLQIIQNKCLRTIVWAPYREPSEPLHIQLQVPPIKEYLQKRQQKALSRYQGSELQKSINSAISAM